MTRQVERLRSVARERGYQVVALIAEQASSLNEKRKGMKKLLTLIDQQAIDVVLIEYPDRLVRFGFGYLEEAFVGGRAGIEVVEPPQAQSPTEELVADVLSIVTVFSGRLYGSPGRKKFRSYVYHMPSRTVYKQKKQMGQTVRTTKLLLDLSKRERGGANRDKRRYPQRDVAMLDAGPASIWIFCSHIRRS